MSLGNLMRREAERVQSRQAATLMGIVSAYNPAKYTAKVVLQPDGQETGFIPIGTPWIGFYAPPSQGDMVDVHFQEWGKGAPYISLRFYGNKRPPQAVQSGEMWYVHKTGSTFRLTNDGKVTIADKAGSQFILNADGTAILDANLIVNGMIQATGDIIDFYTTTGSTMANFRREYDNHEHIDSQNGTTSPPLAPNRL